MGTKMKNAPVYFTIAQVRHNPVLRLGNYVADIQERMRKAGYPDYQLAKSLVFNLGAGVPDAVPDAQQPIPGERHLFFSVDRTGGFFLEQGALSFQTTEYDKYESFSEKFLLGLGIVHECMSLAYWERLGIRYLDAVVPASGPEQLSQYLAPGVLGLAGRLPEGAAIGLSLSETHIQLPDVNLLARTIIRSGQLGFPADLEPQGLQVPERFQRIHGVHAIIDTDASQVGRIPMDIANLRERLDKLHGAVRMAFEAGINEYALKAWA